MKDIIRQSVEESLEAKKYFFKTNEETIVTAAQTLVQAMEKGRKLLLFGNGGSAADAQHIAAEFVNRFQMERRPLPAIALTCDTSIITSIGNDYDYNQIFLKQVQALGKAGDIALGISTSGNSPNVVTAIEEANAMGLTTVGFSGRGGTLKEICHTCFCVDSPVTARIQEVHILLAHILCDLTERMIFNAM